MIALSLTTRPTRLSQICSKPSHFDTHLQLIAPLQLCHVDPSAVEGKILSPFQPVSKGASTRVEVPTPLEWCVPTVRIAFGRMAEESAAYAELAGE